MTSRKRLNPGDLVLGLDDGKTPAFREGLIIAVLVDGDHGTGCSQRLLVLWASPVTTLTRECDCGLLVPLDVGL